MAMNDYNIYVRISTDAAELPVSSFSYSAPTSKIGDTVNAVLADPTLELSDSDRFAVEVGIEVGGTLQWYTLIDGGTLFSDSVTNKWLADDLSINIISALDAKWDLSPEKPITLYDPASTDPVTETGTAQGDLLDRGGNKIEQQLLSRPNFDLHQLLRYIYVEKLGFSDVVTNVKNYPLNSATIGISQSYHSAAASELGVFEPKYSVDGTGAINILDPQGTLPTNLPIAKLKQKHYVEFNKQRQRARKINAVVLQYSERRVNNSEVPSVVVVPSTVEVGTFGDALWQRTETRAYYYRFSDGREVPFRVEKLVSARADGLVRLVSREDQVDTFKYDYRLHTGYSKTIQLYCRVPGSTAAMRTVQTVTSQIGWEALGTAGEYIKRFESTTVVGTVLVKHEDVGNPLLVTDRQSLYLGNRISNIDDWDGIEASRAITTQIDVLRETGRDQVEISTQRINYLKDNAPPELNNTYSHTGTIRVRATGNQTIRSRRVLDREPGPRRVPATFDAGNVPLETAIQLAERILNRAGQEPQSFSVELSGIDPALRRGSLRKVRDRAGNWHLVLITGVSMSGRDLGTPGFNFTMRAEGIKIDA